MKIKVLFFAFCRESTGLNEYSMEFAGETIKKERSAEKRSKLIRGFVWWERGESYCGECD
jgi:hypothetical protein